MRRWAKKYDTKKELPQFVHLINLKNFLESAKHIASIIFLLFLKQYFIIKKKKKRQKKN